MIFLFPPEHEERQVALRALRNRQDLFQEEGILNLILDAIDKITVITSQGYMVALAGEEAGQDWEIISGAFPGHLSWPVLLFFVLFFDYMLCLYVSLKNRMHSSILYNLMIML